MGKILYVVERRVEIEAGGYFHFIDSHILNKGKGVELHLSFYRH